MVHHILDSHGHLLHYCLKVLKALSARMLARTVTGVEQASGTVSDTKHRHGLNIWVSLPLKHIAGVRNEGIDQYSIDQPYF